MKTLFLLAAIFMLSSTPLLAAETELDKLDRALEGLNQPPAAERDKTSFEAEDLADENAHKPNIIYRGLEGVAKSLYRGSRVIVLGFGSAIDHTVAGVQQGSRAVYDAVSSPFRPGA